MLRPGLLLRDVCPLAQSVSATRDYSSPAGSPGAQSPFRAQIFAAPPAPSDFASISLGSAGGSSSRTQDHHPAPVGPPAPSLKHTPSAKRCTGPGSVAAPSTIASLDSGQWWVTPPNSDPAPADPEGPKRSPRRALLSASCSTNNYVGPTNMPAPELVAWCPLPAPASHPVLTALRGSRGRSGPLIHDYFCSSARASAPAVLRALSLRRAPPDVDHTY